MFACTDCESGKTLTHFLLLEHYEQIIQMKSKTLLLAYVSSASSYILLLYQMSVYKFQGKNKNSGQWQQFISLAWVFLESQSLGLRLCTCEPCPESVTSKCPQMEMKTNDFAI